MAPLNALEIHEKRKTARRVVLALGALTVALAVMMTVTYFRERSFSVLASDAFDAKQKQLTDAPDNEALRQEIREMDAHMRQSYFARRRQFQWGGYLILFNIIAMILVLRWSMALTPKTPPDPLAPYTPPSPKASLIAVCIAGGATLLILFGLGSVFRPKIPTAEALAKANEAPASRFQENWPAFRGPDNLGVCPYEGDYPTTWSVENNVNILWKTPIDLPGMSSPVTWGDYVFVTAADQILQDPEATTPVVEMVQAVYCLDRGTGQILWEGKADEPDLPEDFEIDEGTGYAASTPVTDGKRIYAIFGTGTVVAFDMKGRKAWQRDLGVPDSMYGYASSLIEFDGQVVIVQFDQGGDAEDELSVLYGLNPGTGKSLYEVKRPVVNSWSSPAIIRTPTRPELITTADPWVIAYNPLTGEEYWRVEDLTGDVAPSPAYVNNVLYVAQAYSWLKAIRPGGSGDVTETHLLWQYDEGMPETASLVSDGKVIIMPEATLISAASCENGEILWEGDLNEATSSSPILVGDLVYMATEDGVTEIFRMSTEKYDLVDTGEINERLVATPAFGDGQIILRGDRHVIAVGKAAAPAANQ